MLTLNQIHAQIETLANAHYQIAEVGMGTLAELQANPDRLYPLLWLSNEGGSLEDNYKIDNVRLTMFGRVISGEEGQDDDASEIEVLSDMQLILLDFLNYFHQQHAQEYVVAKSASLEHFTERTNDRTAGYSCILELKQFYDWNKCQIPESGASISPSVDGLTLYDFCDQAVIDRLTPTQVACLEDEFGGGGAPAILTANSATFTTVASGGTLDIQIHDTADANVGTVASTSEIEIGNSSNEVNGVDISEPTVAEGTHNQQIQNSAATPVGTAANPSVIGDSQAQVNGVNTETIAATVTHNQQIHDSAGGSVGTAANPSVISDNTINFNGADVDTVKAEESYAFLVKLDGSNSGTYNAGTNTVSVTSAACADATTQVNAVNVGTVASGGTFDQQIHDSAGADVGTAANPSVIADATVRNNATPTWSDTVEAEGTLTLGQGKALDSDGVTTLLADYIPSASGFMFTCSAGGGGSLSVGVSDATPDYGDTITITATPTGLTPTSYTFLFEDGATVTQVSNSYAWDCNIEGATNITVTATDGADVIANDVAVTISTIYAKHTITGAWEAKDAGLVSGNVDSNTDATGNGNTANAPSSTTRLIKYSDPRNSNNGLAGGLGNSSTRRLATTLSQLAATITYFAVFDNIVTGNTGIYNQHSLIGGDATPVSNAGGRYDFRINTSTKAMFVAVRQSSGAAGTSINTSSAMLYGKNIAVMTYDGTNLRINFNGTVQTSAFSGALWTPATCNVILMNSNISSYSAGCTSPYSLIGVKSSSLSDADADQLYDDLLLKYTG